MTSHLPSSPSHLSSPHSTGTQATLTEPFSLKAYICQTKRLSLLSLFLFVPTPFYDYAQTRWYITLASFFACFCIFHNFPAICEFLHSRPLHVEDLEDDEEYDHRVRKRFIRYFNHSMHVLCAIMFTAVINYNLEQIYNSQLSWLELLGIAGGILSLYTTCQNNLGWLLLTILNSRKEKVREQRRSSRAPTPYPHAVMMASRMGSDSSISSNNERRVPALYLGDAAINVPSAQDSTRSISIVPRTSLASILQIDNPIR